MVFGLLGLILTPGVSGTSRGMPYTLQTPLSKRAYSFWGLILASWAGTLWGGNFFMAFYLVFVFFLIAIHIRMSYHLRVVHSGGGDHKDYCLGSL